MSEMVERVAQAISEKYEPAVNPKAPYAQVMMRAAARAAIAAMREPTETMYDAANEAVFQVGQPPSLPNIVWPAMIDAALTPAPMKFPDYPFVFLHRGEDGCGGPIAFLRRKPSAAAVFSSSDAIHIDGRPIEFQSEARCDTCGKVLTYALHPPLAYVEPRN